MGIDLIDLEHRVEREFGITIHRRSLENYLVPRLRPAARSDFQVREYVDWVREELAKNGRVLDTDAIYDRLRPHILDVLRLDEDELSPDAWMFHDLGCG
jgi:hypothetical protein